MQNSHVGLRASLVAPQTSRSLIPRQTLSPDLTILVEGFVITDESLLSQGETSETKGTSAPRARAVGSTNV